MKFKIQVEQVSRKRAAFHFFPVYFSSLPVRHLFPEGQLGKLRLHLGHRVHLYLHVRWSLQNSTKSGTPQSLKYTYFDSDICVRCSRGFDFTRSYL